jgi:uncharacterized protein YkwD
MGFLSDLLAGLFGRPKPRPRPVPSPRPTPAPEPIPPPVPTPGPGTIPALLAAHNAHRVAAGLAPLAGDGRLQSAASYHADRMARAGLMEHQLPGEPDVGARASAAGYAWTRVGENIARNQRSVAEVMVTWMASPGHRANILSAHYTQAGFAVSYGADGDPYWAVDFGAPAIRAASAGPRDYAVGTPEVTGDARGTASSIAMVAG